MYSNQIDTYQLVLNLHLDCLDKTMALIYRIMKFILFIHGYFTPALVILTDLPTLSMGKLKTEEIQHWTRFAQVYLGKNLKVALPSVKNETEKLKYWYIGHKYSKNWYQWKDKYCYQSVSFFLIWLHKMSKF